MTRRWRLSRRRLIGGAAATVCVGCGARDGAGAPAPPTVPDPTVPATPPVTSAPATSAPPPSSAPPASAPPEFDTVGPSPFGGTVDAGPVDELGAAAATAPVYLPEARAYLVAVSEAERADVAAAVDPALREGVDAGFLVLYQKCPHLGCRVPFCDSSGWFDCECHGTRFTALGEHREGPSPRGMDAFASTIEDGRLLVHTALIVRGLPTGTVVVDRPAVGPHCSDVGST